MGVRAQEKAPLELLQKIPMPGLKDGDFDHFAVDLQGQRLLLTAETNAAVEVFDLRTNKLVHTISDVKTPHSMATIWFTILKVSVSMLLDPGLSMSSSRTTLTTTHGSDTFRALFGPKPRSWCLN